MVASCRAVIHRFAHCSVSSGFTSVGASWEPQGPAAASLTVSGQRATSSNRLRTAGLSSRRRCAQSHARPFVRARKHSTCANAHWRREHFGRDEFWRRIDVERFELGRPYALRAPRARAWRSCRRNPPKVAYTSSLRRYSGDPDVIASIRSWRRTAKSASFRGPASARDRADHSVGSGSFSTSAMSLFTSRILAPCPGCCATYHSARIPSQAFAETARTSRM